MLPQRKALENLCITAGIEKVQEGIDSKIKTEPQDTKLTIAFPFGTFYDLKKVLLDVTVCSNPSLVDWDRA